MTLLVHPSIEATSPDDALPAIVDEAVAQLGDAGPLSFHRSVLALRQFLDDLPGVESYPEFSHVFDVVDDLESLAAQSSFPPVVSLRRFWQLYAPSLTAGRLANALSLMDPAVEWAAPVRALTSPAVDPDDPYADQQLHLGTTGVNARPAWAASGADGHGVGFVQIERAFPHLKPDDDLPAHVEVFDESGGTMSDFERDHAAGAMGIVCAEDNDLLVIGIAPECSPPRMYRATDTTTAASAVAQVAADLLAEAGVGVGDVVLVELEIPNQIETSPDFFHAVRLCSGLGLIVVEPSGNYDNDLDSVLPGGGVGVHDSGAIIVGASTDTAPYVRGLDSGYGDRVDCFAWGQSIWTTEPSSSTGYYRNYGGTSGAAAIIAGCAILTQSMAEAALGFRLSPTSMRRLLSDPSLGTDHSGEWAIGVMPDLYKIWTAAFDQTPDLVIRDNLADTGSVPSTGKITASPDIWVQAPDDPTPWPDDETPPSRVTAGNDLHVRVRIQNRGRPAASGSGVRVFYSTPASLVTPPWHLIGQTTLTAGLAQADGIVELPPIPWPASELPAPGHYCFVGVIDHPDDPAPVVPDFTLPAGSGVSATARWQDFVRNNNNVAWRNFNVITVSAGTSTLSFNMRALPDRERFYAFEVRTTDLPPGARLSVNVPASLLDRPSRTPGSWREHGRQKGIAVRELEPEPSALVGRFHLGPRSDHRCALVVDIPDDALADWDPPGDVAVVQFADGRELGRVTWRFRREVREAGEAP